MVADFLYKGVVDWFLDQVSQENISPGDRMPSLRILAKQLELSLNTIIHGYELLSEEGWIESRPKSGYFVCHRSDTKPALLLAGEVFRKQEKQGCKSAWACLSHQGALVDQSNDIFAPVMHSESIDIPVLGKGHLAVRETISDYLKSLGIKNHASQLWLGRSPLTMLTQSIQALTQREDTVLIITPCDPRLSSTLQSLGRQVISIATGDRGVDLDLVVRCLQENDIKLLILPGQFAFPSGLSVSNLSLRRWLAMIEELKLPTIEWDLCSHLAYRSRSTLTYKSLDTSDHVIYIGGIETKGVDRSASWCLPGRYHSLLEGHFLSVDMALSDVQQQSLTDVLTSTGKHSLARRARTIWANSERIKAHLEMQLKDQVRFATSKGGIGLWMYLKTPLSEDDMAALFTQYRQAIVPGSLISDEPDANHWIAINVTLDDVDPLAKKFSERLSLKNNDFNKTDDMSVLTPKSSVESIGPTESLTNQAKVNRALKEKEENRAQRDESVPLLYNPMLDLINHDFG